MLTTHQRDSSEVAGGYANDASDFDAHASIVPRTAQGAAFYTSWVCEHARAEIVSGKKALAGSQTAVFAEAALSVGLGLHQVHHMTEGRRR